MSEDTQSFVRKDDNSKMLGVSVRAWIAVLLVVTICAMSLLSIAVVEPLYSLGMVAVGFYLGQKQK